MQPTGRRQYLAGVAAVTGGCLGTASAGSTEVTVGIVSQNYPFAYRSRCCEWEQTTDVGFDIDVLATLGEQSDTAVTFEGVDGEPVSALQEGQIGIAAPGSPLPKTPDGIRKIGPSVRGYQCLLTTVESIETLADTTVVAPSRPSREAAISRVQRNQPDLTVRRVETHEAAATAFEAGDVAGILDDQIHNSFTATRGSQILTGDGGFDDAPAVAPLVFGTHEYGYLLRADSELTAQITDVFDQLQMDGTHTELKREYFDADLMPRSQ